jgi:DNA-binding transcriptional LysR family regulator
MLNGFVDLGVANLWNVESNLHFEPLLHDQMGLVCRWDHPLASSEETLEWTELKGETLISNDTVRLIDGTHADEVMSQAQFSVSNTMSLVAMLRAGMGVTALPRLALDPDDDTLRFIPLSNPTIQRDLGILTPRRQSLSPGAKALPWCIFERMGGVSNASDLIASSGAG